MNDAGAASPGMNGRAAAGHANDVTLAAQLDTSSTVPVLYKGILEATA